MFNFAMTGTAGYIAPRHLQAIKATNNNLAAAYDPNDSVGILDKYFPEADFFTDYERFERFIEKSRSGNKIDYLSVCSPNHVHDAHIRLALNSGANAICEKPLVLNPANLDLLQKLEEERGLKVYTIMQLRYHPALVELKEKLDQNSKLNIQNSSLISRYKVNLTYITPRGKWYHYSWKGIEEKSGGVVTNIGIHLFDLLIWLFGEVEGFTVINRDNQRISGTLSLKNADVEWFLSIDSKDLGKLEVRGKKLEVGDSLRVTRDPLLVTGNSSRAQSRDSSPPRPQTYRSITIDGEEIEFTEGFTDLHTKVYQEILAGRGLGISDARPSIETVYRLRGEKSKK